uniref:Uncharacterized protein n=1 Tax=Physcomitrium patens TaxID=3218 RepID=A0A2K1ILP2_PHYPA|nr:hypothetical protein PHYPA_026515 [Physcomitrium patens]
MPLLSFPWHYLKTASSFLEPKFIRQLVPVPKAITTQGEIRKFNKKKGQNNFKKNEKKINLTTVPTPPLLHIFARLLLFLLLLLALLYTSCHLRRLLHLHVPRLHLLLLLLLLRRRFSIRLLCRLSLLRLLLLRSRVRRLCHGARRLLRPLLLALRSVLYLLRTAIVRLALALPLRRGRHLRALAAVRCCLGPLLLGRLLRRRVELRHSQPLRRRLLVRFPVLVQQPVADHLLLRHRPRTQPPLPRVRVPLHHHPLHLRHHAVIARRHHCRRHLSDAQRYRLALRRHQHHLLAHLDPLLVPQQPGNHQLRPVADGIHCAVLHHAPLVARQQNLQRHDHPPQVALVLVVVVHPLRVQHVVHRHQVVFLAQNPRPNPTQLLHVTSHSQQQPQVHAQRSNVRPRLARHPEHHQVPLRIILQQLALVDCPNAQLPLHRRDQRRSLKQRARQRLNCLRHLRHRLHRRVQPRHAHVLLSGALLRLHQPSRPVHAHDQAARHLGIQRPTVPGLVHPQHAPNPCHHLVRRRVRRLVQIDHSIPHVIVKRPLQRRVPRRQRRVMPRPHVQLVVILQQNWPLRGVQRRGRRLGLNQVIGVRLLVRRGVPQHHLLPLRILDLAMLVFPLLLALRPCHSCVAGAGSTLRFNSGL